MQKCKRLEGFAILIAKIRAWISKGKPKEEVVDLVVDECIRENILADILEKHKAGCINLYRLIHLNWH